MNSCFIWVFATGKYKKTGDQGRLYKKTKK
jgi:hypothetical protein